MTDETRGVHLFEDTALVANLTTTAASPEETTKSRACATRSSPTWPSGSQTDAGASMFKSSGHPLAKPIRAVGRRLSAAPPPSAQKVVPDLETALRSVEDHCLPIENARAQAAYVWPSDVNSLLILNAEPYPGRTTILLIRDAIGFDSRRVHLPVYGSEYATVAATSQVGRDSYRAGRIDAADGSDPLHAGEPASYWTVVGVLGSLGVFSVCPPTESAISRAERTMFSRPWTITRTAERPSRHPGTRPIRRDGLWRDFGDVAGETRQLFCAVGGEQVSSV